MRLLVTGAAGFIGSNFVRYWIERHPDDRVVAYDLLTYAGNRPNLADVESRIGFLQGDIGDLDKVSKLLEDERIDTIINFANEGRNLTSCQSARNKTVNLRKLSACKTPSADLPPASPAI